jgi:hypothetical protein
MCGHHFSTNLPHWGSHSCPGYFLDFFFFLIFFFFFFLFFFCFFCFFLHLLLSTTTSTLLAFTSIFFLKEAICTHGIVFFNLKNGCE